MFTTRPELLGTFGVVTSTHWLASQAGMSMLEKGGNAFDAAVATGFVLQVVEPHLNGLGGEVPILFRSAKEGKVRVLCGQGVTPSRATIDTYRGLGLEMVPGAGLLAAVVPGAFDAWMVLLRDHGTLALADVLAPAIEYAANGYPLLPRIAEAIANVQDLFTDEWPSSGSLYLKDGAPPAPNELFRNAALAGTYARLVQKAETGGYDRESRIDAARAAFYRGFVAQEIDQFCAEKELLDSSGKRHKGLLAFDDMANWSATYEDSLTYDYEGYTVHKTGPWGQGPVFLQQLALLSGFDLGAMAPDSAAFVHTVVECAKLAFADREAYYGDPNFSEVPMAALLSDAYNAERRKLVTAEASFDQRPGLIPGFEDQIRNAVPTLTREEPNPIAGIGEPTTANLSGAKPAEVQGDTCHLDVIDRDGNVVSATPSGGWLQSSPVIPELGMSLTTRAQMFWLKEGVPGSLAPKKRPRTTLTPSIATRGDEILAFGTPGGDQQDQWSLTFFLKHVHHGLNLQESIDSPLFHTRHFPSSFYPRTAAPGHIVVEDRLPEDTIAELETRKHIIERQGPWTIGRLCAASKTNGILKAAATPRLMQAYAVAR